MSDRGLADHIENRTFDEIRVGDSASLDRRLTMEDVKLFAVMSGDVNPAHVDEDYARSSRFHEIIAHGMWGGSLISTVLGTQLPGPGTIYLGQTLRFRRPVGLGDVVTVTVTAREKIPDKHRIKFDCECRNQDGEVVVSGEAEVMAPTEKISRPRFVLPRVRLSERAQLHGIIELAGKLAPVRTAVVHPLRPEALLTMVEAKRAGLIDPIVIGPEARIRPLAEEHEIDIAGIPVIPTEHSHASATEAVARARAGEIDAILQGSRHFEELLAAVVDRGAGLRRGRRVSHVFAFDVPTYPRPLFITDSLVNVKPALEHKRDIVQNAIDLLHALDREHPRVAILAAIERVTAVIPTTIEAAALCKMAERGQITGGLLDGPLGFDVAVSDAASGANGIHSEVAGRADVLIVPDLEAGTMLAQQLRHLGDALGAGIVLGARVPIIPVNPDDEPLTGLASCALGALVATHRRIEAG